MDTIQTGKKVLILAGDYVEDYEVIVPYQALQMFSIEVHVVCPKRKKGDRIKTSVGDFEDGDQNYSDVLGHSFELNYDFDQVKPENYDGLILPGGRAPEYLRLHEDVVSIVRYFLVNNKPLASICHGLQLLTATRCLKGRKVTCYPYVRTEAILAGAIYHDCSRKDVIVDGNLVTAVVYTGNPNMLKAFLKLLGITFGPR